VAWATHQQAGNLLTESMCQGSGRPNFGSSFFCVHPLGLSDSG
jgi:hypothetical protein